MITVEDKSIAIQSYFEARSNIRELEQRQFNTIHFFLGAFAAVMGGSIGLMQYLSSTDHPFLGASFVFLTNTISVGLYFTWCSVTMMINRAALFCKDITARTHPNQPNIFWETWLTSKNNTSSLPYLIESTLLTFLLPLIAAFVLSLFLSKTQYNHIFWALNLVITIIGISLLLIQYRCILKQINISWENS